MGSTARRWTGIMEKIRFIRCLHSHKLGLHLLAPLATGVRHEPCCTCSYSRKDYLRVRDDHHSEVGGVRQKVWG